jgi:uncharacterized membrane protein
MGNNGWFLLFVFVLIWFFGFVNAIGVSPSYLEYNFKPELEDTIEFVVSNSKNAATNVKVSVEGDLNQYFFLDEGGFVLEAKETKKILVKMKLPKEIGGVGAHNNYFLASEVPPKKTPANTIEAMTAVMIPIIIVVPCEGKCAEANLQIKSTTIEELKRGGSISFGLNVINRGELDFVASSGLKIFSDEKLLESHSWEKTTIKAGERTDFVFDWKPKEIIEGEYSVEYFVDYEGEKPLTGKATFLLGRELRIDSINYDFHQGDNLVLIDVKLTNLSLDRIIGKIGAEILDGKKIVGQSSENDVVVEKGEKIVSLIVKDLANLKNKNYVLRISLNYGNSKVSKDFDFVVKEKKYSGGVGAALINIAIVVVLLIIVLSAWNIFSKIKIER